jgi:uncharacterized protein (TIGR02271 family)
MAKSLVGVFDDMASAQNVVRELALIGIAQPHVRLMNNAEGASEQGTTTGTAAATDVPWTEKIADWFKSLVDDDNDGAHADNYAEAWRRGHYLVVADVESDKVDQAAAIMNRYGSVDLNRRTDEWRSTGYKGAYDRTAQPYTADQRNRELAGYAQRGNTEAIPVVQEELAIGKRVVQRGGVRIHSYVEARPVEEVVRLREERVNVQRRPVNREVAAGDLAFKDRAVEVTASGEEAVVQKRARVVEEVSVGKEVHERDQKIEENVRRQDVQVDRISESQEVPRR